MIILLRKFIFEVLNEYEEEDPKSYVGVKGRDVAFRAGTPRADILQSAVFDMIDASYGPIGGHAKIKTPSNVGNEYPEWIVADIDDDPDPDVAIVGQQSSAGGHKVGASGTDGTPKAKSYMNAMKKRIMTQGWWGEVSGAPAHIAINKLGIKPITDQKTVERLLGKKVTWHGKHPDGKFPGIDGWYTRDIGGTKHTKIIVGDTP